MKHNFGSSQSYDVERFPVNGEARKMLARQSPFDLQDERSADALAIAETIRGSGALARGVSTMEAASMVLGLLRKRNVVESTLAPEVLALKRQELEIKRERLNLERLKTREAQKRHADAMEENKEFFAVFKDVAKAALPAADYSALIDMAIAERNSRLAKP